MMQADQVHDHMHRDIAAGAGDAIPVKRKEVVIAIHQWELFLQCCQALPVRTAAVTIQKPCLGEQIGTSAQTAQRSCSTRQGFHPAHFLHLVTFHDIDA